MPKRSHCVFVAWIFAAVATADGLTATGLAALRVPEGFSVELAAGPELSSYPMFMTFDDRGRMFIAESSGKDLSGKEMQAAPECTILMLEDTDGDGVFDTKSQFADTLSLPMGVQWYRGSLYVASPPEFIRFEDKDGDGRAEVRDVLLSGWNVLNTASLHGPFLGKDGWMYLTHGRHGYKIATKEGETLEGMASRIWRCRPDGTHLERMAGGGFDNPVELIFTDAGETIGTMTYYTDPKNGQRDALMHWVEGGVYPKFHESVAEFVRTGDLMPTMTRFSRIAPAGLMQYRGKAFGPEYAGNLFSAQFNPSRVQRHLLFREGATYRTEDTDFLTSIDPDFHPTDVMEDADGSILVSDTGAWYVDACPISRVAKPEIRGSIYRVRRTGSSRTGDSWTAVRALPDMGANSLAAQLGSDSPIVRDWALEHMAGKGKDALKALEKAYREGGDLQRVNVVWAIARIEPEHDILRTALKDASPDVRVAAARMIGLATAERATDDLTLVLSDPDPSVRRQAATAIGQIGERSAAGALLKAAATAADRFEEHSIVYSLIQLGAEDECRAALQLPEAPVRKMALIALDQMGGGRLRKEELVPFLDAEDESLRKAGLWVASRHPEWSDVVVSLLEEGLRTADVQGESIVPVREVLLAYANDAGVQAIVPELLADPVFDVARRLFLMDAIDQMNLGEFPQTWIERIGASLDDPNLDVRWRAVGLIRSRNIGAFDEKLEALGNDSSAPDNLRIAALDALAPRSVSAPGPARFDYLTGLLAKATDPTMRLSIGKLLARSKLSEQQALHLANEYIANADPLTFAALLDVFRNGSSEAVGLALVKGLSTAKVNPNLIPGGIDAVLASYPSAVQAAAEPLRAQAKAEEEARIARLRTLEPLLDSGDVGRGRAVFFGEKVGCSTCHAVGNEGGTLGPDLTAIGTIRSAHDLLEAILFPSASMVPGYEPFRIDTDFEMYVGVIGRDTPEAITLRTGVNQDTRIPREDIVTMEPHNVSIMPEAMDQSLTQEELIDLIAFLQSLNNEQWLLPVQREK
ncbi:MAG: hypothetical protein AMXMBFR84_03140 [Candidatus Hydrogenedentota bacterium]